jgi:hypothetical protein
MNNNLNTAIAPNMKADSPEIKEVVNFADRFWYVLELKIKKLKVAIGKESYTRGQTDIIMNRIQGFRMGLRQNTGFNSK